MKTLVLVYAIAFVMALSGCNEVPAAAGQAPGAVGAGPVVATASDPTPTPTPTAAPTQPPSAIQSQVSCKRTVVLAYGYSGSTNTQLEFQKTVTTAGDIYVSCRVANTYAGYSGSAVIAAANAANAACEVLYDVNASGAGNFGTWTFDVNGETVTYHDGGNTAFDGTQTTFAGSDCQ